MVQASTQEGGSGKCVSKEYIDDAEQKRTLTCLLE